MKKETVSTAVARNLSALMEREGYESNRKLAAKCDLTDRMIGHIRNKTANPTINSIEDLARVLHVPPWYMLVGGLTEDWLSSGRLIEMVDSALSSKDADARQSKRSTSKGKKILAFDQPAKDADVLLESTRSRPEVDELLELCDRLSPARLSLLVQIASAFLEGPGPTTGSSKRVKPRHSARDS